MSVALVSCKPTPAELLDQQRQERDAAAKSRLATPDKVDTVTYTEPEETIEVLAVDTPASRLQQVLDVVTDTAFFE